MNASKLIPFAASLLIAAGTLSTPASAGYLVDVNGRVVTNNYGECVYALVPLGTDPGAPYPPGCGPQDSDGDGVYDDQDACPDTPKGVKVDSKGCRVDSDGDGVYDEDDMCPNTAPGVRVDAKGCEIITLGGVNFETNKATLAAAAKQILDANLAKIKRNADRIGMVKIVGHTDSRGSDAYNQRLSQKRAQAVADYLAANGVAAEKLSASGMGESQPVADNATEEGRAANRRVEISF
ncbi:OmpA family protein [Endothiovibrio diazotrophicus]